MDTARLIGALKAFKTEVARRDTYNFHSAYLFGSYARGDATEASDVDIAVVLADWPGDAMDAVIALGEIAYDVLLETGVLIQPVPVRLADWKNPEQYSNPRFLHNVRREGVVL